MSTAYDKDVIAWANEQAALLRAGEFAALDIEHVADEIESVGRAEQAELAADTAELITELLKWQHQPAFQCERWKSLINAKRKIVRNMINRTPSLKASPADADWVAGAWSDGQIAAMQELGVEFPHECPWTMTDVLTVDWWPQ
ncbi:MAG: hypothetical protein JWN43_325 [Gammaproteobacteria bacterium]|nr:hypothetical protein [Gammaproteobacteria bacterium]